MARLAWTATVSSPPSRYMWPHALASPEVAVLLARQLPHCPAGLAPALGNAARIVSPAACACTAAPSHYAGKYF